MTLVDRSGNREGEQRRRVATGPGERVAGTREVRQMGVSVIHHPCTGIRVDGNGDGVVDSPGGKAPAAGNGLAGTIEHAETIPGKTRIGLADTPDPTKTSCYPDVGKQITTLPKRLTRSR